MMMDAIADSNGTAFICPECSFNGRSLPELISHLTDAHSEETASKSEAPVSNSLGVQVEKRSRRKPAFSHQIVAQAPRQSLPLFPTSKVDPGSIHFWNRVMTTDKTDENIVQSNGNSHSIRDENVKHVNLTPPRPIAPKSTLVSSQIAHVVPTVTPTSFYSQSMQAIQKNFQCRICQLTYKNFHDCTAHIRRKHEISHAQAGRYVEKMDTDVPLPLSATGHYKIRLKVKSLPPLIPITTTTTTTAAVEDLPKIFPSQWSKDVTRHEQEKHANCSSHEHEEPLDTTNGLSTLLIDEIQDYGEEIASPNDEMIMIEEDNDDDDDDDDDALWKYQQEINNLSESTTQHHHHHPQSFTKHLKRFQCPHCEHTAPTLTKLKLHIATHINIKPYMCSLCGWRANLRWYIQCHAKKRHTNLNFEVLQLSHEEAEQTINAYMKERGFDTKLTNRHDSKHQYQCTLCQFRSNHPRFIQQHIEMNHKKVNKPIVHQQSNSISSDLNSRHISSPSNIVYPKFSSHPNFNPNRLYYCSLCYRGYRWRYDVKRHHKTMHDTSEDETLSKNRNFHYLEYVPHLDSLISVSMSSLTNPLKDEGEDDDFKLSIADARTVDVTDDEAAALLMMEPEQTPIDDQPDDSIIVFEEDRIISGKTLPSSGIPKSSQSRPSFKPYRCPYCFYRTNWRTDCLRHIRARHKIEPHQTGYYEMPADEAAKSYEEYERTYGFVVAKKVLARFTDFRQIEWEELKSSIWNKIKDKTDFESSIIDRLRPENYSRVEPTSVTLPNKLPMMKTKRIFTCMDCAFRSHKIHELEKHICSTKLQQSQRGKSRGNCSILLYECSKCFYRTRKQTYARQHIYLHRSKDTKANSFYSCSFCGYNHRYRLKMILHIARYHSKMTPFNTMVSCRFAFDADFIIRQVNLRRAFISSQLKTRRVFHCVHCPYISTSIVEYDHHRLCHQDNPLNSYQCHQCSFASDCWLYTNQHLLLHTKQARVLARQMDVKHLNNIPITTIYKELLGKSRRYHCPFCNKCASSHSSVILKHIKNVHAGNSNQFHGSLMIGADAAKEILLFQGKENQHDVRRKKIECFQRRMDID